MGPNTLKLIEDWGADLVADVLDALKSGDHLATGRLYASLRTEVQGALDELSLLVYEEDYGKYLDAGRGPGKMPPLDKIAAWCRTRGIPERAAWPIARRIAKFGTTPTNYFRVPLSVRLALLREDLPDAVNADIAAMLKELADKTNQEQK